MNILELVLGQLIQEKNLLESELERVVNDSNLTITERVSKSKNLLSSISKVLMDINVTTGYLPEKKNDQEENNKN
jgi:hypothetical protein